MKPGDRVRMAPMWKFDEAYGHVVKKTRDDYIVICSTGAYGESMSSNYNLRNSLKSYFSDTI